MPATRSGGSYMVAPENDGGVLVQPQRLDLIHNAPDQIIHVLRVLQQIVRSFRGQVLTEKRAGRLGGGRGEQQATARETFQGQRSGDVFGREEKPNLRTEMHAQ